MDINEIKAAVKTIVEEKNAEVVTELKAQNTVLEQKNAELETSLTEVKNTQADLEAKFAENVVQTKEADYKFDVKAANVELKKAMSGDKQVELKALTITGVGGQVLAIDQELGRVVIERARENVSILGAIGTKTVASTDYRELVLKTYPATAEQGEQISGVAWTSTATQTYVEVKMKVGKQYSKPQISSEAVADPAIDIFAHLEVLLSEEISRYWATQVLGGNGTANQIKGILFDGKDSGLTGHMDTRDPTVVADAGVQGDSWKPVTTRNPEVFPVIPTATIGAFPVLDKAFMDLLIDATVIVPSKYLAASKWTMNRRTLGAVRKLRDTQDRPLVQFEAGNFNLVGYPIMLEDYMPDAAVDSFPIIFGDLKSAYNLVNIDENYLVDPYSVDGAVVLKTSVRKGSLIGNNDAIVVIQATDKNGI